MNRRGFIGAILAAGISPAVVRAASLMPVRVLDSGIALLDGETYLGTFYTGPYCPGWHRGRRIIRDPQMLVGADGKMWADLHDGLGWRLL